MTAATAIHVLKKKKSIIQFNEKSWPRFDIYEKLFYSNLKRIKASKGLVFFLGSWNQNL